MASLLLPPTSHPTFAYAAIKNGQTAHLHSFVYRGAPVSELACERSLARQVANF